MTVLVTQLFVERLFCFSYTHGVGVHTETCFHFTLHPSGSDTVQPDTQTRTVELSLRKAIR